MGGKESQMCRARAEMGGRESQMDRRESQIVDGREAKWVEGRAK